MVVTRWSGGSGSGRGTERLGGLGQTGQDIEIGISSSVGRQCLNSRPSVLFPSGGALDPFPVFLINTEVFPTRSVGGDFFQFKWQLD